MKIIINGAKGRMGRIVDEAAGANGHDVVARVDFGYAEGEGLRTWSSTSPTTRPRPR